MGAEQLNSGRLEADPTIRDAKLRAYDKQTGADLAEFDLPANATGSPMTYFANGKQVIVVAIGCRRGGVSYCFDADGRSANRLIASNNAFAARWRYSSRRNSRASGPERNPSSANTAVALVPMRTTKGALLTRRRGGAGSNSR